MQKYSLLILLLFFGFINLQSQTSAPEQQKDQVLEQIEYYRSLFKVNDLNSKIVDNYGNGFESLYGLRNMRPVLHGIVYRGGGNNYYHKTNKRNNHNPLPPDGLNNLCDAGFSGAVYLYSKNFNSAPSFVIDDKNDTLHYFNNTLGSRDAQKQLVDQVYDIISGKTNGPIYLHCWNGWHQSGFASAIILMQFCDYSNKEAVAYWKANADGGTKGYEHIIKAIMNFKPFNGYEVDPEIKAAMCSK